MKTKAVIVVVCAIFALMVFSISVVTFDSGSAVLTANVTGSNSEDQNLPVPNGTITNLMQNPYWKDPNKSCNGTFACKFANDGWDDNQSFQLSTVNGTDWSWIFSKDVEVIPNSNYELVTHMKMNEWANQSHIVLQGFNESSQQWYQMLQCPSGVNGPLQWQEFTCDITVPGNVSKINLILNAGRSSHEGKTAVTFFDAVKLFRIS